MKYLELSIKCIDPQGLTQLCILLGLFFTGKLAVLPLLNDSRSFQAKEDLTMLACEAFK
jgi:hypothetical protein